MTPAELAAIHAEAMTRPPPWSAAAFAAQIAERHAHLHHGPAGFALGRTLAGESELLTIAVRPALRRRGEGAALLGAYETEARARGAETAFLEVAEDNAPAIALYFGTGWRQVGRRRGYYAGTDALVFCKALP